MAKAAEDVKAQGLSADIQLEKLEALKKLIPEAFSEGKLDAEKIRKIFDAEAFAGNEEGERFRLEWAGKAKVFDEIARRTSCTLALDEKRSSDNFNNSQNIFIEGENLEVLRMLQKAYHGKVKMIYIDPPYNTGHDFVYNDDFRQTEEEYNEDFCNLDENGNIKRAYTKNSKDSGRYHSNWLSMIYPRLYLAKNLLKDNGVIFVSIDDNEVHNLRAVMNEIFGEENFVAQLIWNKQHSQQQGVFKEYHEYVLCFSKSKISENISGGEGEIVAGALKKISKVNPASNFTFPAGTRVDSPKDFVLEGTYGGSEKVSVVSGKFIAKNGKLSEEVTLSAGWTQKDQMKSWFSHQETIDSKGQKVIEFFFNSEGKLKSKKERSRITPPTFLPLFGMVSEQTAKLESLMGGTYFENPKPVEMISLFAGWFTGDGEIILDFFSGSGTTAEGVMKQNAIDNRERHYICIQLPEATPENSAARKARYTKISDIAIDRIKKAAEKIQIEHPEYKGDLGVRVYSETDSNFPQWYSRSFRSDEELTSSLLEHANRIPTGDEQARVTEVLLKLGYPLTVTIEQRDGFCIADGTLALVLDESFKTENLSRIFEVRPSTVVVLERVFKDDSQKINFALRCKEAKIIFQTI